MQLLSFITTRPPDPIMAPTFFRESKSSFISRWSSVALIQRHPPEGPPIWTALKSPPLTPPPMSKITSRSVVPIGTSINPVLFTFPVRANAFVPWLFSGPNPWYHFAPFKMIGGTLQNVSTLFKTVGLSNNPCSTVRGGLTRGMPRFPSIDVVKALPSPHTKAPAPWLMWRSKSNPEPKIFFPRSPLSIALSIAVCRRSTASGYSART